jgi:4-hydroxy-tetrahydrodipicolinate reductase
MNKLIIVGNGKLATAIQNQLPAYLRIETIPYTPEVPADSDPVFVHVGSGRQYSESLNLAISCGASYVQAATGKEFPMEPPAQAAIRFIHAPNLDLSIIRLFHLLKTAGDLFHGEPVTITESHQKEKQSTPGTAVKFCDYLNLPRERIVSIRDPLVQKELGIRNTGHHAFHRIAIGDEHSKITIETSVEGATGYVRGLARILQCLPNLDVGRYEVEDLVALKLL